MEEIWKDINGFEGMYQASSIGRVRSMDRILHHVRPKLNNKRVVRRFNGRILSENKMKDGYLMTFLGKCGKMYPYRTGRLIAQTFVPNPHNKPEVNHINGIKSDNRIENLEWVTASENSIHAHRIGLTSPARGERIGCAKLNDFKVRVIRRMSGFTQREVAEIFGVSQFSIWRVLNNRGWILE